MKETPDTPSSTSEWDGVRLKRLEKRTAALSRACENELAEIHALREQVETMRKRAERLRKPPVSAEETPSAEPVAEESGAPELLNSGPHSSGRLERWVDRISKVMRWFRAKRGLDR